MTPADRNDRLAVVSDQLQEIDGERGLLLMKLRPHLPTVLKLLRNLIGPYSDKVNFVCQVTGVDPDEAARVIDCIGLRSDPLGLQDLNLFTAEDTTAALNRMAAFMNPESRSVIIDSLPDLIQSPTPARWRKHNRSKRWK